MKHTPPPPHLADAYCRAFRAGVAWSEVLSLANVHRSTWSRMLAGQGYRQSTLDDIEAAIDSLLAPDPGAAPARKTKEHRTNGS